MLAPLVRRLSWSGRRGRVAMLALSALLLVVLFGSLLYAFVFNHPSPLANLGKSMLLLSSNNKQGFAWVKLLTMVRTSDGKVLWTYSLQGDLANGFSRTIDEQLRDGTAVHIVNGIVYLAEVFDARPDRPAMSPYALTALRADTGALLWQQQTQATSLEILGISQGVLVAQATLGSNSTVDALTASGYRAETGSLVWTQQMAQHISYHSRTAQMLNGFLYVGTGQPGTFSSIVSIAASTGKTLWQYLLREPLFSLAPLFSEDGVVVLEGVAGDIFTDPTFSLRGLRTSDGALLWSHEISRSGGFPGTIVSPFQESAGVLYFATNVPEKNDLELNALEITRGTLRWHQQLTAEQSISGRELALANGTLYVMYTVLGQGDPASTAELTLQTVQASNGSLGWKKSYHPGRGEAPGLTIVEGTTASAVVAESSASAHTPLIGLDASDGAMLWQDQRVVYGEMVADGQLIAFSRLPPPNDLTQQLCALHPDTGAVLWCHDVDGIQSWALEGP